jgi:ribosomal protein S18
VSEEENVSTVKHKYGVNNNVLLTDDEYEKLKESFPRDYGKRIDSLSSYIASTGKAYKSHYFTILNWKRRETGVDTPAITGGSFDTEEFANLALKRSYESIGLDPPVKY